MSPQGDTLIDRNDVEVQVEHRLAGRRFVELGETDAVSAGGLLHRSGDLLHQWDHRSQSRRIGIEQVA
ncbi:hypothetical protein D3C72_2205750 [compost metagenome]